MTDKYKPVIPDDAGRVLLPLARAAIGRELGQRLPMPEDTDWMLARGACFVTLKHDGALRGCIGTVTPHQSLGADVRANALGAAFRDPRFKPLGVDEFARVHIELSVLSPVEPLTFGTESEALAQLRPGIDGVVFRYGHHHSTFLPQVWEDLQDGAEFLAHLKHKAGLPPDFWDPEVSLSRYTVSKWCETPFR